MTSLLLASLRRRWLEYGVVAIAIAVVVAAVLAQRTFSASARRAVHELSHQLGSNMLVVPEATDMRAFWRNEYGAAALTEQAARRLGASDLAPHLRSIESRLQGTLRLNGADVVLVGTDAGSFAREDGDVAPAVVTRAVAAQLGVAPGRMLDVQGVPVSVAAVIDGVAGHPGDALYVPLAAAQRILRRPGAVNALQLGGCWCSIDVATLGKDVERLLPGTRAITVAGMLAAQKGTVAVTDRYASLLQVGGAAFVALLVAGVVASQARRRNRELALFSAMGADPAWVAAVFTAEAAVTAAVGAALGHALASVAGEWLGTRLLGAPWTLGWELLVPTVLVTSAIGALAAAIPALRAARRDVTTVLREA